MNGQIIHLETQCINPECNGFDYYEDETGGYYICADCNTISQIRCGLELEYTYPIRDKLKQSKNEDDDAKPDEGSLNENNDFDNFSQKFSFEGLSTTNIKSNIYDSTINDYSSIYSRSSRRKAIIKVKSTKEILIEIQGYFENIINTIITDFFNNEEKSKKSNDFFQKINFSEEEKKFFYEVTRKIWIYFLSKKYKSIDNPVYKRKKLIRSRNNSIDEERVVKKKEREKEKENGENNNAIGHHKSKLIAKKNKKKKKIKKKEIRLHEQAKMRRITERNVYNIFNDNKLLSNFSLGQTKYNINKNNTNKNNFYMESNFNPISQKKIILKKFIEEYDQVIKFIKKDKCFDIVFETEEEKEKINITNVIEYEQLIRVCEQLGIDTKNENYIFDKDEEYNFETLIHLIYKQQFNYKINNDEKSNEITNGINSNHFLFLIYEIFYYNKIPLLISDILFNYKNFSYVNKLSLQEINFLYLLNFRKFKAHINWFDNRLDDAALYKKAESIIDKICTHVLKMPEIFNYLCKYVLKLLHNNEKIKLIISTKYKYIIEHVCLGIILYCLKIIYGLNDLPYMCLILNNINKGYFNYDNDIDLKEEINIYKKNTKNDKLCQIYLLFPTELDIIQNLINELKIRNNNSLIIYSKERKLNYSNDFKSKYIDANLNNIYKNFNDDFTHDIDELEKKYKNHNNKLMNKKNKKEKKSWNITKTKMFEDKIESYENPIKQFNPFLKEEINFHEDVYKDKDNNVEFPLPFDTYIRMKKHSQKILQNFHRPSEMMFIYLFCEYFKIDYLSLRSLSRLVEYYMEKIYVE